MLDELLLKENFDKTNVNRSFVILPKYYNFRKEVYKLLIVNEKISNNKVKKEKIYSHQIISSKTSKQINKIVNRLKVPYSCIIKSPIINIKEKIVKNRKILLDFILFQREKAARIITSFFILKKTQLKIKRKFLCNKILKLILKNIILIQSKIRGLLVRKHIQSLHKCDYIFFYKYDKDKIERLNSFEFNKGIIGNNENSNKTDLKIIILSSKKGKEKEISLLYSRYLNCYYLPFIKKGLMKRFYKVNFKINGFIIIDPSFQVDSDINGNFYNLIPKALLYNLKKKKNINSINIINDDKDNKKKYWETIFVMKRKSKHNNSYDSISMTNSNISNEFSPIMNINKTVNKDDNERLKPILKEPFSKTMSYEKKIIHKVSFSNVIQYSY